MKNQLVVIGLLMVAGVAMAGEVKTTEPLARLEGLFGVKLGETFDEMWEGKTNDQWILTANYQPKKEFLSFKRYTIFATPKTMRVCAVQAIASSIPSGDASLLEKTKRMVEMRFGGSVSTNRKDFVELRYSNGDYIRISQKDGFVSVCAVNSELMALALQEAEETKKDFEEKERRMLADDIKALQIVLKKTQKVGTADEKIDVCSVLGETFGEKMPYPGGEKIADGCFFGELQKDGKFTDKGFKYEVFGSAKSRSVFRVRAWKDKAKSRDDFERLRRMVEIGFKREMKSIGNGDSCSLEIGNILVTLSMNVDNSRLSLDFTDVHVYKQHEDECKKLSEKFWEDIDAL